MNAIAMVWCARSARWCGNARGTQNTIIHIISTYIGIKECLLSGPTLKLVILVLNISLIGGCYKIISCFTINILAELFPARTSTSSAGILVVKRLVTNQDIWKYCGHWSPNLRPSSTFDSTVRPGNRSSTSLRKMWISWVGIFGVLKC